MKQDRFLIGILAFIGVLVLAALVLFFVRQEQPVTYRADDTPEGVVYNFALAIQRADADKAYAYLADLDNKPTLAAFRQALLSGYIDTSAAVEIGAAEILDDHAYVPVGIHYQSSGPFDGGWESKENATLVRQSGAWKIQYMPYPYWNYDWYLPVVEPVYP